MIAASIGEAFISRSASAYHYNIESRLSCKNTIDLSARSGSVALWPPRTRPDSYYVCAPKAKNKFSTSHSFQKGKTPAFTGTVPISRPSPPPR